MNIQPFNKQGLNTMSFVLFYEQSYLAQSGEEINHHVDGPSQGLRCVQC